MSDLLHSIKNLATDELIKKASSYLGENESSITKALGAIMPSILTGILDSKSESQEGIAEFLGKAGGTDNMMHGILNNLSDDTGNAQTMSIGGGLLENLFGNKLTSITNIISNFAGIKSSSSSSLLGIGASLVASFLGKKMLQEGLNFKSLLGWLTNHKAEISTALPEGFAQAVGGMDSLKSNASSPIEESKNNKWVFPLLLLALLAIGLFWWLKGCNSEGEAIKTQEVIDSAGASINNALDNAATTLDSAASKVSNAVGGMVNEAGDWIVTKGDSITIKMDNGTEIHTFKGNLEDKFHSFIKDPSAMPGKDIWFSFDDLLFESGKSNLKPGYETQLNNTCEILKAYPAVKIKLGGYTDNIGDSLTNVKLSESRAKTVYNQMINKGVAKTSFDEKPYEGYGPEYPVADNATAEGKAQNRRISLSVRAK